MKKIIVLSLCVLLLFSVSLTAFAEEITSEPLGYLTDDCLLLTEEEATLIEEKCEAISMKHNFGVYIFIIEDYTEIEPDVYDAAVSLFEKYSLGFGEKKDGVILLLSMDDRDYSMVAHGFGETAFDEYARNAAIKEFKSEFSYDEWSDGLDSYLDKCDQILKLAHDGISLKEFDTKGVGYVISFILAALIAIFVCVGKRLKMRSVFKKGEAMNYIAKDSGNITSRNDTYTHTTTTRTKVSSSSSSGSRSRSGGGYSGSSGKF